jgi:hypothetical protein
MAALAAAGLSPYRSVGPSNPLDAVPYTVVYAGMVQTDGPVSAPYVDMGTEFQVTAVGGTADQAEWAADAVCTALVGTTLAPPAGRAWLSGTQPICHVLTRPIERDDDIGAGSPLFYVPMLFAAPTTPA